MVCWKPSNFGGYYKYYNTQVFPLNPLASREASGCRCSSGGNSSVGSRKESSSSGRSSSSTSSIEGLSGSTSTSNSGSTSTSNSGSTSTSSDIDLNGVMPHLEVVEEEVKSTCNKEEEKKNVIEEVEVKNNEIERQYEVEEVIDKRKSRFGKKGGKRKGVDYKVKWKEAYPGEYGKDNITWVRDIDLDAEEALEKYAEKRNKDYTEIERQERQEEQIENNEEETKEEKEDEIHKSEQEIEEQIQAFLTGVGDEKTDGQDNQTERRLS